jgi:hypothetical protein
MLDHFTLSSLVLIIIYSLKLDIKPYIPLMQEYKWLIHKQISIAHYINIFKKKKMITSDEEGVFDKNPTSIHNKICK